jgi:hypothetical protein
MTNWTLMAADYPMEKSLLSTKTLHVIFVSLTAEVVSIGYWTLVDIRDPANEVVIASNLIKTSPGVNIKNFRAICAETNPNFPSGLIVISWVEEGAGSKEDVIAALFDGAMTMINTPYQLSNNASGTHNNNNQDLTFNEDQTFVIFVWESGAESFDGGASWNAQ